MFLKLPLFILFFLSFPIFSQTVVVDYEYMKYNNKGKVCLLDKSGKKLTKFIYDYIELLNENAFITENDGLFGVISKNGEIILEPLYDNYYVTDYGLVQFELEDKSIIVNTKFKSVSEALDYVSYFDNGFAEVKLNQKRGIIDSMGKLAVPIEFDYIENHKTYSKYNKFIVGKGEKVGLYEIKNGIVLPIEYHDINEFYSSDMPKDQFSVKLVKDENSGKIGIYNLVANIYSCCEYDAIDFLSDEIGIYIESEGKSGMLNYELEQIVKPEFQGISKYDFKKLNNGNIMVNRQGLYSEKGKNLIPCCQYQLEDAITENVIKGIDTLNKKHVFFNAFTGELKEVSCVKQYDEYTAKEINKSRFIFHNKETKKQVLIDENCKELSKHYDYINAGYRESELLIVRNNKDEKNHLYGVINLNGSEIIPCEYSHIENFYDNSFLVTNHQEQLVLNEKGKVLSKGAFQQIHKPHETARYYIIKKEDKLGVVDLEFNTIVATEYQQIDYYSDNTFFVRKNGKYGLVNYEGKELIVPTCNTFSELEQKCEDISQKDSEIHTVIQRKSNTYGVDFNKNLNLLLWYNGEMVTFYDVTSKSEINHIIQTENPPHSAQSYFSISEAGFINDMYVYVLYYTSGGGGQQLLIYNIRDGKSQPLLTLNEINSFSGFVQYTLPHPTNEDLVLLGIDKGSRNDIYELNIVNGSSKVLHKGQEGQNVNTYRVVGGAKHNKTHFAFYDQISNELWVHNQLKPSTKLSFDTKELIFSDYCLTHSQLVFAYEKTLSFINLTTGKTENKITLEIEHDCYHIWFNAFQNELYIVDKEGVFYAFSLKNKQIEKIQHLSSIEDYVSDVKVKAENAYLITNSGRISNIKTKTFETINEPNIITKRLVLGRLGMDWCYSKLKYNEQDKLQFSFLYEDNFRVLDLKKMTFSNANNALLTTYSQDSLICATLDLTNPNDIIFSFKDNRKDKTINLSNEFKSSLSSQNGVAQIPYKIHVLKDNSAVILLYNDRILKVNFNTNKIEKFDNSLIDYTVYFDSFISFSPDDSRFLVRVKDNSVYALGYLIVLDSETLELVNKLDYTYYHNEYDLNHHLSLLSDTTLQYFDKVYNLNQNEKIPKTDFAFSKLNSFDPKNRGSYTVYNENKNTKIYGYNNGFELFKNDKKVASFYLYDDNSFIVSLPNKYYFSNSKHTNDLVFRSNFKSYPLEQFDLKYNRPDIILDHLGYADSSLVKAYHQAYLKRLKKMNFTEEMLKDDFHLPEIKIENFEALPSIIETDSLDLNLNIKDSKYPLDRINVWINDVAIYGTNGISIRDKNTKEYKTKLNLKLAKGENKIQVSVLNQAGAESYKETFTVNCKAGNKNPNLYLISIGVSEFKQKQYNLKFAAKDAEDIAKVYANNKNYGQVITKTLTNQEVTKENIEQLEQFLKAADRNDEVILFFAGHGVLDTQLDYYLASFDMDFSNPSSKGIAYESLENLLDGIAPLKKTLLLDACHSGEIDKEEVELAVATEQEIGDVQFRQVGNAVAQKESHLGLQNTSELTKSLFTDLRKGTGATVISSAGGMEFAMESSEWQNGLFTYCLLHGLKTQKADLNKDGIIMLSELQQYVATQVTQLSNGKQQPTSRIENNVMDWRVW